MVKIKTNKKYIKSCVIAAIIAAVLFLSVFVTLPVKTSVDAAAQPDEKIFNSDYDIKDDFAGGDGKSEETAFLIATPEQLNNVRNYLGDTESKVRYYFKQIADIDLTDFLKDSETGWHPIGTDNSRGKCFYGVYDGGLFEIKGLWFNRPQDTFTGLFGFVESSKIKNIRLTISDFGITGCEYTGGIAGEAVESRIESCSVTGLLKANGRYYSWGEELYLGGLIGHANQTVISGCRFWGTLADDNEYRGSLDTEEDGVSACGMGGIAGCVTNSSQIVNSYAKISVITDGAYGLSRKLAGICGTFGMGENKIENCFTQVYGENSIAPFTAGILNGLTGWGVFRIEVYGSYYFYAGGLTPVAVDIDEDVFRLDLYSRGLTAGETGAKSVFIGKDGNAWDFTNVWGFDRDGNLILRAFGEPYDPSPPIDLTWLWITIACIVTAAAAAMATFIIIMHKKPPAVKETETIVVTETKHIYIGDEKQPLPNNLTPKEREVAALLLEWKSRKDIMEILALSANAVNFHIKNIYEKCECHSHKQFIVKYGTEKK